MNDKIMSVVDSFKELRDSIEHDRCGYMCTRIDKYIIHSIECYDILQEALLNVEKYCDEPLLYSKEYTVKETLMLGYPFWGFYNYKARVEFLNNLIKELEEK